MKTNWITLTCIALIAGAFALSGCGNDETCSDGELNQNEVAVDCGGDCPACASCTDGVQNQDETGIDCGGVCSACATCTDGIKNGNETQIDCGGDCPACPEEHITCDVDGVAYAANLVAVTVAPPQIDFQSDQSQERQFFFSIPEGVQPGQYQWTDPGFSADYGKLFQGDFITYQGMVTIDPSPVGVVQGTFGFNAWEDDGFGNPTDTVYITNGSFFIELN